MIHYITGWLSLLGYGVLAVAILIPVMAVVSSLGSSADSQSNNQRPVDREDSKK